MSSLADRQTRPASVKDDIVVVIGGTVVNSSDDLGDAVQQLTPGDTAVFSVDRDRRGAVDPGGTVVENTDADSEAARQAVCRRFVHRCVRDDVVSRSAAVAVNSVTDIFPTAWQSSKGVIKVLNPVNVFSHLNGTNDDLSKHDRPRWWASRVSAMTWATRPG